MAAFASAMRGGTVQTAPPLRRATVPIATTTATHTTRTSTTAANVSAMRDTTVQPAPALNHAPA